MKNPEEKTHNMLVTINYGLFGFEVELKSRPFTRCRIADMLQSDKQKQGLGYKNPKISKKK